MASAGVDRVAAALLRAAQRGLIPPGASVLLAVSGGADSMALLHAALAAVPRTRWRIAVGHVHHGWRGRAADRDLSFVADHARRAGVPSFERRCDAAASARRLRLSPEAGARHARYAALHAMAREAGATLIATAHQRDDAIESHRIARERHGGLAALAGPRERRDDGVVRPLLGVSRAEILGYLAARGATFRRDASNGDLRLARNRIRRARANDSDTADDDSGAIALIDLFAERRARLDAEYAERIAPAVHRHPDGTLANAAVLAAASDELLRVALDRIAAPFAREGRPPMTGRERERLIVLLSRGGDFRFEAGRRIRFEHRGGALAVRPVAPAGVYDSPQRLSPRVAEGDFAR